METSREKEVRLTPSLKKEIIKIVDERIREAHITREDFSELKNIVKELAEAQKRTEEGLTQFTIRVDQLTIRVDQLTVRVDELAQAQRKTEERLNSLAQRVEELAEAQKRTEQRVDELAQAQRKTEERLNSLAQRVEELAEAQKRTEQRLEELAHAQKRTEEELRLLIKEHERTREILSGISDTVGYGLEDKIFPYLYDFARKEFGVEVEVLDRRSILYTDGRSDEVNIYVEGRRDGEKVYIIGECKSRPSIKEVDNFWNLIERLREHFKAMVYPFLVGYTYSPSIEEYLRDKYPEIKCLKSFEFELKYKPTTPLP